LIMTDRDKSLKVTVHFERRDDGGLSIRSDDLSDLYRSYSDPSRAVEDDRVNVQTADWHPSGTGDDAMFPWPRTDNPIEWLLGLLLTAVWGFLVWFWRAVAAIVTGRGTFAQWLWVCLLVAPTALVLGAAIASKRFDIDRA